jgi:hypothetical protein
MSIKTTLEVMDRIFAVLEAMKDVIREEVAAERLTEEQALKLYKAIGRGASAALQHAIVISVEEEHK